MKRTTEIRLLGGIMVNVLARSSYLCAGAAFAAALALPTACTDQHPVAPAQSSLATRIIVSAPNGQVSPASITNAERSPNVAADALAASSTLVYVSLPLGSISGGSSATIRNRRTGDLVEVSMVDGGFDPTPIAAVADDDLTIDIRGGTSVLLSATIRVPRRRPPTIVRSEPPNGKTEVPLNEQIEVVFSEPVDPTSIPASLQLLYTDQIVSGLAIPKSSGLVAEFAPNASLAPNTQYTLVITTGVRDLAGEALEQNVRINFTTGAGAETEPHDATTVFCAPTPPSNSLTTTAAFTPVGDMSQIHGDMTTLLPDGRVLVFGGTPFNDLIWGGVPDTTIRPVAEVYDPAANTFSPADNMVTFRGGHPAVLLPQGQLRFLDGTLLQDGRVFFARPNSAETYDPVAGTFMPTGGYAHTEPSTWNTRTVLLDGRVLLTGSVGTPQRFFGATELFDPKTGTFKKTGSMHGWSDTPGLGILLADGTVLFVQWNFDVAGDVAELYDPTTETFNTIGCLYYSHEYSAGVRLRDGTVLITGGQLPGGNGSTETLLYLPATRAFAEGPSMNVGRHSHSATLLRDGTVLIAGGYSIWPNPTRTAEIFRPAP
jgi:Big-like domain-containing protein